MDHIHETTKKTKSEITVNPSYNFETSEINIDTHIKVTGLSDVLYRKTLHLEEAAIRETLIKLGWTPPKP